MDSQQNSSLTRITQMPALPVPIERPKFDVPEKAEYIYVPNEKTPEAGIGLFALASLFWKMVPDIYHLLKGILMKNWKTTLGAIISAVATLLSFLGIVEIPTEVQIGMVSFGTFMIGLFASDAPKKDGAE